MTTNERRVARTAAVEVVSRQLREAIDARKCHGCGCLHETVEALARTAAGQGELAPVLATARVSFTPKQYDCLGCAVCYPAIAANAFGEAFPEEAEGFELCPTEAPLERRGWPPLPGDFTVLRHGAPVAICTLNSEELRRSLSARAPAAVAIIGALRTENLGIERLIQNVLANPHLRFLVVCGEDTRQAVGHLPGQSLESLFAHGVDPRGRITGAAGRRPVLRNVRGEQLEAFLRQVELRSLIGEEREAIILDEVDRCAAKAPGPFDGAPGALPVVPIRAASPRRLTLDPAGYLVVYPDGARQRLVLEHFSNDGVLGCVIEGLTPAALYGEAIERGLVTRLDHAAYLGRELARAERSLQGGEPYVQDRAAGELGVEPPAVACGCGPACATGGAP
ncbi:MAG: DUF4346 domain-containing protein [Deltaproteobacteria bacterium]